MPNPTNSTTHKLPFQDITDRFISPARPKRKPKIPGGALGEKLRLRVIETTKSTHTHNAFPSSLPPSSPPLYSSSSRGVPLFSSEDEIAHEMQEEDEETYGRDDFGSMLPADEDGDEDAENRAPANLSDPFGFFAVERRLKAEREVLPAPVRTARCTDDKERDDGRVMPSTPHKPKLGKRRLSATADVFSPATTSLVSSPSPVKGGDGLRARASTEDVDMDMDTSRELFPAEPRARRKADEDDAPPKKKSRQDAALPRRSTRAQSKVVKEVPKPKPKTRGRKAPAKTKVSTGKKKATENNDSDDDQHEKFEAERQARLEYFKKLDDYSFEKENVYVV